MITTFPSFDTSADLDIFDGHVAGVERVVLDPFILVSLMFSLRSKPGASVRSAAETFAVLRQSLHRVTAHFG